jgi:hypothetical protein
MLADLKAEHESLFAGGDGNAQPGISRDSEISFAKPTLQPNVEGTTILPIAWMALTVVSHQLCRIRSSRREGMVMQCD